MTANGSGPVSWAQFAALSERVSRLEEHRAGSSAKANRAWLIVIGIGTGVVCPLIVTTLLTLLHLRSVA